MNEKLISALQALLFIYGEPMDVKKAAITLEVKPAEVEEAAKSLAQLLTDSKSGLALIFYDSKIQLTTKPEFSSLLEKIVKSELNEALTPAGLETLSIIAYSAPVSRAEIDYIRGVNSTFILRSLLLRGLIDRDLDPKRSNAYIYKPSFDFLKHVGVSRVEDLPEFEKFSKLTAQLRPSATPVASIEVRSMNQELSGETKNSEGGVKDSIPNS
ncbi:MAG: SMC-Scp complex subunit ScpB [bacterium]|nr:SMC-Scp complex subunit ScpB [bacterium]